MVLKCPANEAPFLSFGSIVILQRSSSDLKRSRPHTFSIFWIALSSWHGGGSSSRECWWGDQTAACCLCCSSSLGAPRAGGELGVLRRIVAGGRTTDNRPQSRMRWIVPAKGLREDRYADSTCLTMSASTSVTSISIISTQICFVHMLVLYPQIGFVVILSRGCQVLRDPTSKAKKVAPDHA